MKNKKSKYQRQQNQDNKNIINRLRSFLHKFFSEKLLLYFILICLSILLTLDLFLVKGQPANMDGTVHITNIAIFHNALSQGDLPVRWTDGFANYGLPMGSFAQQITSYLGGFITFLTNNPILSYNLVYFIGTFFSLLFFYLFLSKYSDSLVALGGSFLFNFAPYRIMNLYIRGALPEYFSSVFVALILLSLYYLIEERKRKGFFLLSLSVCGLILTHPMNVITASVLIVPYIIFLLSKQSSNFKINFFVIILATVLGLGLSSYYTVPLLKDIQFFYYGAGSNHYNQDSWLDISSIKPNNWHYFHEPSNSFLSRGHVVNIGFIESLIIVSAVVYFIYSFYLKIKRKCYRLELLDFAVLSGICVLFLVSRYSVFLYEHVNLLSNIQFQWRMLSSLIFIVPLLFVLLLQKIHRFSLKLSILILVIVLVGLARFPQLYSKNDTLVDFNNYYFTVDNLHSSNMNTVWTEKTTNYPVKENKIEFIKGKGTIQSQKISNSWRKYQVNVDEASTLIDYTFYFPGWKVYANNVEVPIEFQNIDHRGVITYELTPGKHDVEVRFTNTKTVVFANVVSCLSLVIFCVLFIHAHFCKSAINKCLSSVKDK